MSTRTTITEEWASQQREAYGPDVWEGTVEIEVRHGAGDWEPPLDNTAEVLALQAVRRITGFLPKEEGDWQSPRLVHFGTKGAMHVFHYRVERAYND